MQLSLRRFTDFVLQNRIYAAGIAFVLTFIPVIGTISILIAALVTLRKSILDGFLVFCAASLPYVISYVAYPAADQTILAKSAVAIVLMSNLITWVFAVVLRHYRDWSVTLELVALLGVLIVSLVHIFYPDIQSFWGEQLKMYLGKNN